MGQKNGLKIPFHPDPDRTGSKFRQNPGSTGKLIFPIYPFFSVSHSFLLNGKSTYRLHMTIQTRHGLV
jgi:hypothetical protein